MQSIIPLHILQSTVLFQVWFCESCRPFCEFDLVRHVALSELGDPSGRAQPEFSCIPLSQCKLQAVCCRERLHVTVLGKIAILSLERASNWTNIQQFNDVSKYSCMARSLVSRDRMEFLPRHIHPPSGSL